MESLKRALQHVPSGRDPNLHKLLVGEQLSSLCQLPLCQISEHVACLLETRRELDQPLASGPRRSAAALTLAQALTGDLATLEAAAFDIGFLFPSLPALPSPSQRCEWFVLFTGLNCDVSRSPAFSLTLSTYLLNISYRAVQCLSLSGWTAEEICGGLEEVVALSETACRAVGLGQTHTLAERVAATRSLEGRPWTQWGLSDVQALIDLLHRAPALDCRGGPLPCPEVQAQWERWLDHHWGVRCYLDPHAVFAEGGAVTAPAIPLPPAPPIAPGWVSAALPQSRDAACALAGAWRQAGMPRVVALTFNAGSLLIL